MKHVGKQICLLVVTCLLLIGGLVSAVQLTTQQQQRIDTAVVVITHVMERYGVSAAEFASLLEPFKTRFVGQSEKLAMIKAVERQTVDDYYGVENFEECTLYYDGCNECQKGVGSYEMSCTERACINQDSPSCLQYATDPDPLPPVVDTDPLAELCDQQGGTRLAPYQECEEVSQGVCEEMGGTFVECGSACRHDPDAQICTLQCVPYCMFDDGEPVDTTAQAALDDARSLWAGAQLDSYEAEQQMSCFCPQEYTRPVRFDVVDGEVDTGSAVYADQAGGQLGEFAPELHTVTGLFGLIQDAIDDGAEVVEVTYDDQLGYPTSIWIDVSSMMADEEQSYTYEVRLTD